MGWRQDAPRRDLLAVTADAGTGNDKILLGKDGTHTITVLDHAGTTLRSDSNEVAMEGVTAKSPHNTETSAAVYMN